MFDSAFRRADQLYDSGYKKEALALVSAAHAALQPLSVADEMNYYAWSGETYRKDYNDYDKYIIYADSIIYTLQKTGNTARLPNRYIQALNMKADAFFEKGIYDQSFSLYYSAWKLAGDNGDSCSLSQFSYSIGMVLYRQQKYLDAARYFSEAHDEINHCKDEFIFFYRKQELLDNIGLCYFHAGLYDSARLFYSKALAFIDSNYLKYDKRESVYLSASAVVYGNLADLYIGLKQYDTATALLKKSISINLRKGNDNSDALLSQVKLGRLYLTTGQTGELRPLLLNISAEQDTLPGTEVKLGYNYLMWKYSDEVKDYSTAYRYLQAYQTLSDSLEARNKAMLNTDAVGRIRIIERQYQIARLSRSSMHFRIYIAVATVITIMALIIILLILRSARRSRRNINELTRLNNEVSGQKEQLQIAVDALEVKDKEKTKILRSAAHDILNPLSAMSGLTDILISEAGDFTPQHKEILQLLKEACDNSLALGRDVLEAASAQEATDMQREKVNINRLLASCVNLLGIKAAGKQQRLQLATPSETVEALVNKEKIWRIINNLVGNAIKFSFTHSVIHISLTCHDGKIDIAVKDSGIGIPEKNKPFIFDMFSQARSAGTGGEAPHGLGLSISLQIARSHQGTISFESQEGQGSTFHLILPQNLPA